MINYVYVGNTWSYWNGWIQKKNLQISRFLELQLKLSNWKLLSSTLQFNDQLFETS
jgi:hypothetical protein